MLDDLLGRTALKQRIAALEDEIDDLEARLDAEDRRRKEAVTAKQEAERDVNRLESKIAELEDRLEGDGDDAERRSFRVATVLRREATEDVRALLDSVEAAPESLRTVVLPPGGTPPDDLPARLRAAVQRIDAETGVVAVADDAGVIEACLVPPIDVADTVDVRSDRFHVPERLFVPPERYVLAVVRSDGFAAARYVDGAREATAFHRSDVKSQHSKGGFSQGRFERIRDEQIRQHLDASYGELRKLLDDGEPDRIAVVGDRGVANDLAEEVDADCPVQVGTVDATGSGEALLEDGHEAFWRSRLYVV